MYGALQENRAACFIHNSLTFVPSSSWSLGRQDKFSCILTFFLILCPKLLILPLNFLESWGSWRDVFSMHVLCNSCIIEMRSNVCLRFFRISSIMVGIPRRSKLHTWRVSLGISFTCDNKPVIRSFVSWMSFNFSVKQASIILIYCRPSCAHTLKALPLNKENTTKRVEFLSTRKGKHYS